MTALQHAAQLPHPGQDRILAGSGCKAGRVYVPAHAALSTIRSGDFPLGANKEQVLRL